VLSSSVGCGHSNIANVLTQGYYSYSFVVSRIKIKGSIHTNHTPKRCLQEWLCQSIHLCNLCICGTHSVLRDLAQLVLDRVRDTELLAKRSTRPGHLELEEELGSFDLSDDCFRVCLRLYAVSVNIIHVRWRRKCRTYSSTSLDCQVNIQLVLQQVKIGLCGVVGNSKRLQGKSDGGQVRLLEVDAAERHSSRSHVGHARDNISLPIDSVRASSE
jgi:hypothetical protein